MSANDIFIGIGQNPDGPDLPLGLGMRLAQEPKAMEAFGKLTAGQKEALIRHIQSGTTGEEAERLLTDEIERLKNGG